MDSINLWESITAGESNWQKFDSGKELRALGPQVTREHVTALSQSARFGGQELSLEPKPEGWVLKVFSCYDDHEYVIEILIPKDQTEPVKVLKDRTGQIMHMHD